MKASSYILLALLVGFYGLSTSFSQNLTGKQADSLISASLKQTGEEKLQTLRVFLDGVAVMDPDTVFRIAESTLAIAERKEDPDLKYAAMAGYCNASMKTGQVDRFLEWNLKIKDLIEQQPGYSRDTMTVWNARMVSTLNQIGTAYAGMGNLHSALDYFLQSHRLMEKFNYTRFIHISHYSIGRLYGQMKQYDESFFHLQKALELSWEIQDSLWVCNVYEFMGWIYGYQHKYDSALFCYKEVLRISLATGYKDLIAESYHDIGKIYGGMDSNTQAIQYIEKAYEIKESIDFSKDRISMYYSEAGMVGWDADRGAILQALGRNQEAMKYLDRALENLPYAQDIAYSDNVYRALYLAHKGMGNLKEALYYHEKMDDIKDSIYASEKRDEVLRLKAEYEDEKKQQSIQLLEKENQLNRFKLNRSRFIIAGIGGLIGIIILISYMGYRQMKLKNIRKQVLLEQRLLRAQMNPHFIFNALSSIQGFIVDNDPINASLYLSRFSKLIRNILDNSAEEFVTLSKEIATIENYLALQKLRYEDKFDYSIDVDENIDPESVSVPPMLAQPFIENSVEHGIKHKATQGHIDIRFSLKDQVILFEVEDDGVGRSAAKEIEMHQQKDHRSMATAITLERLSVMNKKLRKKIHLNIADLLTDEGYPAGTRVNLEIPVI